MRAVANAVFLAALVAPGCAKLPVEDAWMIGPERVDALEKPKADSKIMMEMRRGEIVMPLSDVRETIERDGKKADYRRVKRLPEDHGGLVPEAALVATKAPSVASFCRLLGEADDRRCLLGLARASLGGDAYLVFRPSVAETGRLAFVDGTRFDARDVRGLREVAVRSVGGRRYFFVESALREAERFTHSDIDVLTADRSLRSVARVRLEEDDTRNKPTYVRTALVFTPNGVFRRGKSSTIEADGTTKETAIDEPVSLEK